MDISHITSQSLLHLLSLAEKKSALIKAIEEVNTEIAKTIKGGASSVVEALEVVKTSRPKVVSPAKAKAATAAPKSIVGRSGSLKDRILELLDAAGAGGLRVKEIAEGLGIKGTNISVWFSTTGKKHTKRLEPGRYAAKGAKPIATVPSKAATSTKTAKASKERKMSTEARARIGAAAKARWAAHRASKVSAKPSAPAKAPGKKGFKQSKFK